MTIKEFESHIYSILNNDINTEHVEVTYESKQLKLGGYGTVFRMKDFTKAGRLVKHRRMNAGMTLLAKDIVVTMKYQVFVVENGTETMKEITETF